jgi:RNA polymerase sigma-70 factor, ECF subfamily
VSADGTEVFEAERPRLQGIAYAMTGQVMDSEDLVQEAWIRWHDADRSVITNPGGWLTTVVSRLAIDWLRSARHRREHYVGPWLPEPLVTGPGGDPADLVAEAEQLSMAFLMALERLNPVERAVLILREVFDLDYHEIAPVVERSADNCRQIAMRARRRIGDSHRSQRPSPEREQELVLAFVAALAAGDVDAVRATLAADAVVYSDGGGKARAALHPILGADRVARFMVGVTNTRQPGDRAAFVTMNGAPSIYLQRRGVPFAVITLQLGDDTIIGIHNVLNPDKLAHLAGLDAPIEVEPAP